MRKIITSCLVAFALAFQGDCVSAKSKVKKNDSDNITVFYKGKQISDISRKEFVRICINSLILDKIDAAEEGGRVTVYGNDDGTMTLIWEDENDNIIKMLKFKI